MNPYSQQHIASNLHTAHTCIKTALACVEAAYSTVRDERKLCERLELSGITSAITEFEINIRRALLTSPNIHGIFFCSSGALSPENFPGRARPPAEPSLFSPGGRASREPSPSSCSSGALSPESSASDSRSQEDHT